MRPFDARLLRLVPEARPAIALLFAAGALQGLAAIGQAFALSALVVAVVGGQPWATAAGACVAAFGVRAAAAAGGEALAARTGVRVSTALRRALLARTLDRPTAPDGSARALTLATQGATSVEPYVARYLPTLANAAVLPPAAVLAMLWLDRPTGLIPVLTVPLLPVFAALIGAATAEATQRRWRTLARLSGHFLDVMRGLPTLVSYGRATRQVDTIRAVSHDHRRATVATLKLAFLSSAALELLATISVAIVAVWVGIQLAGGSMELGLALPLILLAPEAYWPIRRVGAEFHAAADGATALADIATELGTAYDEPVAPHRSAGHDDPRRGDETHGAGAPGEVTTHGLGFRYGPDLPDVLTGLDLRLGPGLTVVAGPSGAGKTTLLELLAGLRAPTAGTVSAPPAHLVTQRPFLAPASLRDNLLLGAGPGADDRLAETVAEVGLTPLVEGLPDGMETRLGEDGFGLSAGQRARVALARAVLADSAVLLLDEPTAHLDPRSERAVEDLVLRLAQDRPVVAVSHREGLLTRADQVITLGGGR